MTKKSRTLAEGAGKVASEVLLLAAVFNVALALLTALTTWPAATFLVLDAAVIVGAGLTALAAHLYLRRAGS